MLHRCAAQGQAIDFNPTADGFTCNSDCIDDTYLGIPVPNEPESIINFISGLRDIASLCGAPGNTVCGGAVVRWGEEFSNTDPVHIDDGANMISPSTYNQQETSFQSDLQSLCYGSCGDVPGPSYGQIASSAYLCTKYCLFGPYEDTNGQATDSEYCLYMVSFCVDSRHCMQCTPSASTEACFRTHSLLQAHRHSASTAPSARNQHSDVFSSLTTTLKMVTLVMMPLRQTSE